MCSKEALTVRVREYFASADMHAVYDEDRGLYLMLTSCPSKVGTVIIRLLIEDGQIIAVATCPMKVDANDATTMQRVSEYFHRVTYGMKNGTFDFDFNDGEAQFRTSMLVREALPSDDTLGFLIAMGPTMWSRFGDGFFKVAFEGADPKEAAKDNSNDELMALLQRVLAAKLAAQAEEGTSDDEAAWRI